MNQGACSKCTFVSQKLYGLAKDIDRPLEVQLGIGGVGQAVPRMDLVGWGSWKPLGLKVEKCNTGS